MPTRWPTPSPRSRTASAAAIVLRFWHDCTEVEIAAALGCRPGTVGSLIHRAARRTPKGDPVTEYDDRIRRALDAQARRVQAEPDPTDLTDRISRRERRRTRTLSAALVLTLFAGPTLGFVAARGDGGRSDDIDTADDSGGGGGDGVTLVSPGALPTLRPEAASSGFGDSMGFGRTETSEAPVDDASRAILMSQWGGMTNEPLARVFVARPRRDEDPCVPRRCRSAGGHRAAVVDATRLLLPERVRAGRHLQRRHGRHRRRGHLSPSSRMGSSAARSRRSVSVRAPRSGSRWCKRLRTRRRCARRSPAARPTRWSRSTASPCSSVPRTSLPTTRTTTTNRPSSRPSTVLAASLGTGHARFGGSRRQSRRGRWTSTRTHAARRRSCRHPDPSSRPTSLRRGRRSPTRSRSRTARTTRPRNRS